MKLKANITGFVLLFCLVFPAITTVTWYHVKRNSIRREVKRNIIAGIDKAELVLLKFTEKEAKEQLNWKHAHEFEYAKEMYDIVESRKVNDTIYYWCWWDHEEARLNKQRNKLASIAWNNNPQRKENQERLYHFFKSLYTILPPSAIAVYGSRMLPNFAYQTAYTSFSFPPPTPPPRLA